MYELSTNRAPFLRWPLGATALLAACSIASAAPQADWMQESDNPAMGPRYAASLVYDDQHAQVLAILGGHAYGYYSEVWAWATTTRSWTRVWDGTTSGPADRGQAAADNDGLGHTWTFGGYHGGAQKIYYDDTWMWDGCAWTEPFPGGATPGPRSAAAMVWSPGESAFILFGGWDNAIPGYSDETWRLDPVNGWSLVHPGGGGCPSPRGEHEMVWDSVTNRVLLFGGSNDPYGQAASGEMWVWDGGAWTLLDDSTVLEANGHDPGPGPRFGHGLEQDPVTGFIYLFGGLTHVDMCPRYNDLWAWHGAGWVLVDDGATAPAPDGRSHTELAFVDTIGSLLLYGGEKCQGIIIGDTWTAQPVPHFVTTYCIGAPNSVGDGARIGYAGTTSISANDFHVMVSQAPPQEFGLFFYGPNQDEVLFGNGWRCVKPWPTGIFRLNPAQMTSGDETADRHVDFTQPPADGIHPGEAWNFQFWYRDPAGGGAQFNLSDALHAVFLP